MEISERDFLQAKANAQATRVAGYVVLARYDSRHGRVVLNLNTGVHIAFPVELAEGLAGAARADLAEIEISPSGTGLHWPRLDADLYIPALLQGVFGSKNWMARPTRRGWRLRAQRCQKGCCKSQRSQRWASSQVRGNGVTVTGSCRDLGRGLIAAPARLATRLPWTSP